MKIFSFSEDHDGFFPIEIELALWPGIPSIQFLGLPDSHLRESALRIKSALKSVGFEFPIAQQIVVNLKPTNLKKSSRGVELAVALAYLWTSGQVPPPIGFDRVYIYGSLSLFGEVEADQQVIDLEIPNESLLITLAQFKNGSVSSWKLPSLSVAGAPEIRSQKKAEKVLCRPDAFSDFSFSEKEARMLMVAALGGHHLILAGPAGGGKSTLAQVIHALMPIRETDFEGPWPPLIQPHHTTPMAAMIGGGSYPILGEISRAHSGVLILDELLEFEKGVLEALREPFEQEKIRVSRLNQQRTFPVRTQIVATTNLCPCGKYTPNRRAPDRCRFSLSRCRSYSQKLSGPLVDRFQMMYFSDVRGERTVPWEQVLASVQQGFEFQKSSQRDHWPRRLTRKQLQCHLTPQSQDIGFTNVSGSERRSLATLRVARTIADLEKSDSIKIQHIDEALAYTMEPFGQMDRLFL